MSWVGWTIVERDYTVFISAICYSSLEIQAFSVADAMMFARSLANGSKYFSKVLVSDWEEPKIDNLQFGDWAVDTTEQRANNRGPHNSRIFTIYMSSIVYASIVIRATNPSSAWMLSRNILMGFDLPKPGQWSPPKIENFTFGEWEVDTTEEIPETEGTRFMRVSW
jgi:hypothetical protein